MNHETGTEFEDLARALREGRPTPEPEFAERLDRIVADHFPPGWARDTSPAGQGRGRIGNLTERFRRRMSGRRLLLPAVAGVASVLMFTTVVAIEVDGGRFGGGDEPRDIQGMPGSQAVEMAETGNGDSAVMPELSREQFGDQAAGMSESSADADAVAPASPGSAGSHLKADREVALEAEITLGTEPSSVQDVANEIVSVTDDHNGIVMDSSVVDGEDGAAGASFRLLIPSAQIDTAVADLSGIADLRSRSQELTDITAPVNSTEGSIADSKAKIEGLLGELSETYDEDERAALERRIHRERVNLRAVEARLDRLERRADYTPVSLRVETTGDTSSDDESSWGFPDAVDDAGKLLGVAAGVTVLALAVAIPIGIIVLVALAMNRAWVRRARHRALGDE